MRPDNSFEPEPLRVILDALRWAMASCHPTARVGLTSFAVESRCALPRILTTSDAGPTGQRFRVVRVQRSGLPENAMRWD
jgi:hypothetical protein